MAIYVNYTPTSIIGKAMFNFDVYGIANFKYSGVIRVSTSDSFIYNDWYYDTSTPKLYWGIVNNNAETTWFASDLTYIKETLDTYSQFANLTFSAVTDYDRTNTSTIANPEDVGIASLSDINIATVTRYDVAWSGISGAATDNQVFNYAGAAGDIFINNAYFVDGPEEFADLKKPRQVLMHELGHSLGLSHPHSAYNSYGPTITSDYAATNDIGFSQLGFRTSTASDMYKEYFSIMSYDDQNTYVPDLNAYTPMILDVIALQQAYGEGSGTSGSGNDTIYAGTYGYRTYFDKGGTDTIDLSMYSYGAYFHMGATIVGANHLVGIAMSLYDADNTINYADNPVSLRWFYGEYENATGSFYIDAIVGNKLANNINGLGGDDYIEGGDGNDAIAGGDGNDELYGQAGDDTFDWDSSARLGNDIMYGGAGDDTYCISGYDTIVEYSNEGIDTVWVDSSYSLANTLLENVKLYNDITGGYTLTGNSYGNIIQGAHGNDIFYGGAGDDTFQFQPNSNGLDAIADAAVGDKLIINGAYFSGAVTQGYGSNVGLNQIQCYTSGTSTTLCIGSDSILGADITIKLNGLFALNQFQAQGAYINIITYVNHAPTGTVTIAGTATQNQTLTANNTFSDIDGLGTISYQWKANGTNISGATSNSLVLTNALVGKAITVVANYTDGYGAAESLTSSATSLVANVNDAPTTIDLYVSSVTGSQSFTGVLGWANDPDVGDTLSLYSVSPTSTVGAKLSINGTDIIYTPATSFNQLKAGATANDSFSYTIKDSAGATSTAIIFVELIGVNDPPTAANDSAGVAEGGQITLLGSTLLSNDTDIDSDVITIKSVPSKSNKGASLSFTNGNITYSDGTIFQSLKAGATTTDSFNYTIMDELGLTSQALVTMTITGVNDAPTVFNSITAQLAVSKIGYSFTVPNSTFVDKDTGDTLTYKVTLSDDSPLPSWLSFNDTTHTLSGTPAIVDAGIYSLSITATDSAGLFVTTAFSLNVDTKIPVTFSSTNDKYVGSSSDERIDGGAGNDTLNAGGGNDELNGGDGADKLIGDAGDDTYIIADANSKGKANDVVTEKPNEGTDTVISSIASYTLVKEVEILQLKEGSDAVSGIGFKGNETIIGNSAANTINGKEGNDTLTGGGGNDTFVFDTKLTFTKAKDGTITSTNVDIISDFISGSDVINLSKKIFAKAAIDVTDTDATNGFNLTSSDLVVGATLAEAKTAQESAHFLFDSSNDALYYDADGSGTVSSAIQVAIIGAADNHPTLAWSDLLIVA